MITGCCDSRRRDAVAAHPPLNGIEFIEVIDRELPATDPLRQRTLLVHFLRPAPTLAAANIRIDGGERITGVSATWAAPATPAPPELSGPAEAPTAALVATVADPTRVLVVRVNRAGDYSSYVLRLATSATDDSLPDNFDPQLSELAFSFKVECPSDFDCRPVVACTPPPAPPTDINYVAKDYASFRRLLLDRLSVVAPQWTETSVADQGVTLAELLAYVGDHLSYQQDAIATEAYLGTARQRISLRRHAVMVDYPMHDGCCARVWLHLRVAAPAFTLTQAGTQFLTRCPGDAVGLAVGSPELEAAMHQTPTVFEPLHAPTLYEAHNEIAFYTWGDGRCCLPAGTTSATLAGHLPDLAAGDALLFEEVFGPDTGEPGDADPAHRHIVRLTSVKPSNPATILTDPLTGDAITEITWAAEDALPFALCLSAVSDDAHGAKDVPSVSVARGNLVLVDHGQTVTDEVLGLVPAPTLFMRPGADGGGDRCAPAPPAPIPARYNPRLAHAPLTQAGTVLVASSSSAGGVAQRLPFDPTAPAVQATSWSMEDVLPALRLKGTLGVDTSTWQPRRTLLASASDAPDFVAEIDDDGGAVLRFGDDEHGKRPDEGTAFSATYRVGNGAAGNVGAETIHHFVASAGDLPFVLAVRNPLAATGGINPESAESVRRNAPEAFRVQERAVTTADYAAVAERYPGVQRAAATLRWTGSWYTVFITVDPQAGRDAAALRAALPAFVDRFRMAGHDLEVDLPRYVSLEVSLHVCVEDDHFRSDVRVGLLQALSNGTLSDGRLGLFHPDNFTFGQTVFLSPIYAAALGVPGVSVVEVTGFAPQGSADGSFLTAGAIPLGGLEIARLDNDPSFPEHGVLHLDIHGGK